MNTDYTQVGHVAGVRKLFIVSDDGFLNTVEDGVWLSVEIKPNAYLTEIIFAPNTCGFTYAKQPTDFGISYQVQLSCSKPKITKELRNWLDTHGERSFVLFAQDFNFQLHILGVPDAGLLLATTSGTGQRGSDRNLTELVFVGQMIFTPFIFENFDMNFFTGVDLTDYATQDFRVMRSNSLYESIQFSNPDGSLQDLSADQFVMNVVNHRNEIILTFSRIIVIPGIIPEGGDTAPSFIENGLRLSEDSTTIYMEKSGQQMLIEPGLHRYDMLRISDVATKTILKGHFIVEANISNPPSPFV